MKFIADVMLGRLAKRMRLLGFDVLYDRTLDDNMVIRLSLEQDRIILTRDTGLACRPLASNHLFIADDDVSGQIRQVRSAFPSDPPGPLTRCSVCNELLSSVEKRDVRDLVPDYVYAGQKTFFRCGRCGRIYWKGTHIERMGMQEDTIRAGTMFPCRPAS